MPRLEKDIENEIRRRTYLLAESMGIKILFLKLSALGVRGMPDRVLLYRPRGVLFLELKKPGEVPGKMQVWMHGMLRELGFEVEVHDHVSSAMASIEAHLAAATPPD